MTVKRTLYNEISAKLAEGMPNLEWIGLNKGQFARLRESYPIPRPCALISITRIKWEDDAKRVQKGLATITVSLFVDAINDTYEGASDVDNALDLLDYSDDVYASLGGFKGDFFESLKRTGDNEGQHTGEISTWSTVFETTVYDNTKAAKYTKVKATPSISVEIENPEAH
jgi:hypothetical protein